MNKRLHFQPLIAMMTVCLTFALFTACSSDSDEEGQGGGGAGVVNVNKNDTSKEPALSRLEFPKVKGGDSRVLIHSNNDQIGINFSVEWDTKKQSQRWTCYQLTGANRESNTSRYSAQNGELQYPFDPKLGSSQYFKGQDPYKSSGFDHGHICPSADRLYSREANIQTFYLTNMQPQNHEFNDGVWKHMEAFMRERIAQKSTGDTLFICKGGTIDKDNQIMRTLSNGLIVPKYFFMAALRKKSKDWSNIGAIGFYIEHKTYDDYLRNDKGNKYDLSPYVVNIRELERLTGIDFFCNLPDDIEEMVETKSVEFLKDVWAPMVSTSQTISN